MRSRSPTANATGLAVLAAYATAACGGSAPSLDVLVTDSAGIRVVTNLTPDAPTWTLSAEPRLDLGTVDQDGPEQFFQVADATVLSDGRLAIANGGSEEIRFFDASGAFDGSLGGAGEGPGESLSTAGVAEIDGDSLIAWDARQRRFTVFGPDGRVGRTFSLRIEHALNSQVTTFLPDGGAILGGPWFDFGDDGPGSEPEAVYARYQHMGPTGELVDTLPRQLFGMFVALEGMIGSGLFSPRPFTTGDRAGYWVGAAQREEVTHIGIDGAVDRVIRWPASDREVTGADVDRELQNRLADAAPDAAERIRRIHALQPVSDRFPTHAELLLDRTGSLWVRRYERPDHDDPARWMVFDPDGVLTGWVETPRRMRVFEIGEDYVLGVDYDELDVEHVRMYDLYRTAVEH